MHATGTQTIDCTARQRPIGLNKVIHTTHAPRQYMTQCWHLSKHIISTMFSIWGEWGSWYSGMQNSKMQWSGNAFL